MPETATGFDDSDDDDDDDDDDARVSDCPECGAEVYLIADCCPKCGYWFEAGDRASMRGRRGTQSELRIVKVGSIILVVALIVGLIIASGMTIWG